jgi:mono/diheme cytochrome c family protein
MSLFTRKTIAGVAALAGATVAILAGFVWSGIYDVGADAPHWRPTYAVLETLRERSIDIRAGRLQVPSDLASPTRIRQGAGNYAAMCMGCHLAPGLQDTEMSRGLYPAPPDLSKRTVDAARAFWIIKHGIKASGMPAWGPSMDDDSIWNLAAFLQQLPTLDGSQYKALVDSSEGHSHGGGETGAHGHARGTSSHDNDAATPSVKPGIAPHVHAPGTPQHDDGPSTPTPAPGSKPHADTPEIPQHGHGSSAPGSGTEPAEDPRPEQNAHD